MLKGFSTVITEADGWDKTGHNVIRTGRRTEMQSAREKLTTILFLDTQQSAGKSCSMGTRNCRQPSQWHRSSIMPIRLTILTMALARSYVMWKIWGDGKGKESGNGLGSGDSTYRWSNHWYLAHTSSREISLFFIQFNNVWVYSLITTFRGFVV